MPVLVPGSRSSAPASSTKVMSFSPSCGPPAHGGEGSRVCYRPSLSYSEPDDDPSFRRMQGRRTPAILRDRQAGEELAQDVFVKAYQRLDTFAVRRPMKPWLVQIAISGHPCGARLTGRLGFHSRRPSKPPSRNVEDDRGEPPGSTALAACRARYPRPEQMARKMLRNVEIRGVHAAGNGPSSDRKCWQRLELGIHGLNRWTVKCLEMSRKRGVQTDKTPRARTDVLAAP